MPFLPTKIELTAMIVTEAMMASVTFIVKGVKMGLGDLLAAELGTAQPKGGRLSVLLNKLAVEEPEEYAVLEDALKDERYRHATITKAIRAKYGVDAISSTSVREYRLKNGIGA